MSYFKKFGTLETNYSQFEVDGTYKANGTATTFNDLRVAGTMTKPQGSNDPDFSLFKDNGAGSTGVWIYWFDKDAIEELWFNIQIPHDYKEGTHIKPHVHWVPKSTGDTDEYVKWGLEYHWSNMGDPFDTTSFAYSDASQGSTATTSEDTEMQADKHYVSVLDDGSGNGITGTNKTISSMLNCRLFRVATDATDDYPDDAGLLEIDFHYEKDTLGSRTEWAK